MPLDNKSIVTGMQRALAAGQSLSSLTSNPHFASLSMKDKREVLRGLKEHVASQSISGGRVAGELTKGTLGGAATALPLSALVPVMLTAHSEGALNRKGLTSILKAIGTNTNAKMLLGLGAGMGAGAGLINSALALWKEKKNRDQMVKDLETVGSPEGMASAIYGAYGNKSQAYQLPTHKITKDLRDMANPHLMASTQYGAMLPNLKGPSYTSGKTEIILDGLDKGVVTQEVLDDTLNELNQNSGLLNRVASMLANRNYDLGLDSDSANHAAQIYAERAQADQGSANRIINKVNELYDLHSEENS